MTGPRVHPSRPVVAGRERVRRDGWAPIGGPRAVLVLAAMAVLAVLGAFAAPSFAFAQEAPPNARVSALEERIAAAPRDAGGYIVLASLHREAGRADEAERTLRRGIERAADAEQLRWALAQLMLEGERWADAVAALEPLEPDSAAVATTARLRVNVGVEAYRAGEMAAARAAFERALEGDPTLTEAAIMLGQLLVEMDEAAKAREVIDAALRHSPDEPWLLAVRSATLTGREGLEAAIKAARAARRERPDDDAIGLELARLLLRAGEVQAMLALHDTLLAGPRPNEETFLAIANFWLGAEQADTAVSILTRAVHVHPASGELWQRLGDAEWGREEWRGAALAYRMAAARLERPERAEMAVADAYAMAGDTAAAVDALRSMRERPATRPARLQVAARAASLGDTALAVGTYTDLFTARPDDEVAIVGAAALVEASGDTLRALELYQRATELPGGGPAGPLGVLRLDPPAPDSAQALLRLALWRAVEAVEAGERQVAGGAQGGGAGGTGGESLSRLEPADSFGEARETLIAVLDTIVFETDWGVAELEQLRRAYPRSLLFRRYAVDLAARDGRHEEALAEYDRLITMRADDVDLQLARARTLEALGRTEEARAAYTRTLELEPENVEVFRALVRLRQADDTLTALLEQVRRLRTLFPDLDALMDREIELLHRLGRLTEAREAARKHQETSP